MDELIPERWREDVINALRSEDKSRIIMRESARLAWQAAFPSAWNYDLYEAIRIALEVKNVTGRQILDMAEPGETYAFWFHHEGRKLYGKICVAPSRHVIIMYSAHPPRKGEEQL
jgi:hypothetical protein